MASLFQTLSWPRIACRQAPTGNQALCRCVFVVASLLANGGDKRAVASLEDSLAGQLLIWIDLSIDELNLFSGFFCFLFTWSVTVDQGLQGCLGDGGSL
jgi:hypothetical protein